MKKIKDFFGKGDDFIAELQTGGLESNTNLMVLSQAP